MQEIIYESGDIKVIPTISEYVSELWEVLQIALDKKQFIEWFNGIAKDGATAFDKGEIIGCAGFDNIYPGYYATAHIFKRKDYSIWRTLSIIRHSLPYFFEKYNLEKIVGITREDNKTAIRFLRLCGLRLDGLIRHHAKINGQWQDYVVTSILREEVYENLPKTSN